MLLKLMERAAWAGLFACVAWIATLLGGCATHPDNKVPCQPGTCSIDELLEESRDPFPQEPISFGSIFGPQPLPGRITVDGVPVEHDAKVYNPETRRTEYPK